MIKALLNALLSRLFGLRIHRVRTVERLRGQHWALVDGLRHRDAVLGDMTRRLGVMENALALADGSAAQAWRLSADLAARLQVLPQTAVLVDRVHAFGRMLAVKEVAAVGKVRLGGPADGGYVCLDDFVGLKAALSVGIGPDVSWDKAVADRGLTVFQYDHTVEGPPERHAKFVFHRTRLTASPVPNGQTLAMILQDHGLMADASVLAKIDIEGDEWDVLAAADSKTLGVFSQLVCEFHTIEKLADDAFFERAIAALTALAAVFEPVHVHANTTASLLLVGNVTMPSVLEVTFVNRQRHAFKDAQDIFPTALDAPNTEGAVQFPLGRFRY